MNRWSLLRRHWKLLALLALVVVLLLTVFGNVAITVPEIPASQAG